MILIIDNYDSFTYNIAQALGQLGKSVRVARNDAISAAQVGRLDPEAIVISPGPGTPDDAGVSMQVIADYAGRIPILGVCLGHQCIGQAFGGLVTRAIAPVHGKVSRIFHDGQGVFAGLRNPLEATRYHSLIVTEETVAAPLVVSAFTTEGEVMGLRAAELMIEGVQFHPESAATPQGLALLRNFVEAHGRRAAA